MNRVTTPHGNIDKGDGAYVILGQSHLVKTVEDIHEALVVRSWDQIWRRFLRGVRCRWCVGAEPTGR